MINIKKNTTNNIPLIITANFNIPEGMFFVPEYIFEFKRLINLETIYIKPKLNGSNYTFDLYTLKDDDSIPKQVYYGDGYINLDIGNYIVNVKLFNYNSDPNDYDSILEWIEDNIMSDGNIMSVPAYIYYENKGMKTIINKKYK